MYCQDNYEVLYLGPLNLFFIFVEVFFYCVLYRECLLREIPLYIVMIVM